MQMFDDEVLAVEEAVYCANKENIPYVIINVSKECMGVKPYSEDIKNGDIIEIIHPTMNRAR